PLREATLHPEVGVALRRASSELNGGGESVRAGPPPRPVARLCRAQMRRERRRPLSEGRRRATTPLEVRTSSFPYHRLPPGRRLPLVEGPEGQSQRASEARSEQRECRGA